MSNHTPGAWEVKREGTFHHRIMLRKGDYCPMIADVHAGENIANLMASAPELLDALKKLVGWYDCFQLKEGEADLPVIVKSRAAIAKAENTTC